ncbi:MAG: prepilin-type N-terminal cleavage/methylation domain-containing protein [Verrucomicrobia bacterium]|nr:prepilin-type N-terminal cleavage/methylation domain-containing protein [Verrucomicrobiota bacterium]
MKMALKGFTLVEVIIVVAIIGLLSAIGIPYVIGVHSRGVLSAQLRNITEVNKAKAVLTLPVGNTVGAMSATRETPITQGTEGMSNLLKVLKISSMYDLSVGGYVINLGSTVGDTTSYNLPSGAPRPDH